jgi:hypothetical protein
MASKSGNYGANIDNVKEEAERQERLSKITGRDAS